MIHVRQRLRQAIVALLIGLPTTGARVFAHRPDARPFDPDTELPCLHVLIDDESVNSVSINSMIYERSVQVRVIATVRAPLDVDQVLNQIALEVEQAIASDYTISGLCSGGLTLTGLSEVDVTGEGEILLGRQTLQFVGVYITAAASPQLAR